MTEEYLSNSCSSECFFEYKMNYVSGDSSVALPKLYFERDYTKQSLPYALFAVPQEWLEKESYQRYDSSIPYDNIKVVFDVSGLDSEPLTKTDSEEYIKAEIKDCKGGRSIDDFYREGCRLNIVDRDNSASFSGVGVMDMCKGSKLVTRFYFAVNFAFKTKIHYTLTLNNSKLSVLLTCKERPQNIRLRLIWNESRLPCLKNDMGNTFDEFEVNFKKDTFEYTTDVGGRFSHGTVLSLTLVDEVASNFYVLHCDSNNTVKIVNPKLKKHPVVYTCPFCHQKMDSRLFDNPKYKRGGISCGYYSKRGPLPTITEDGNRKAKNCLYCSHDLGDNGDFDFNFMRLLPKNFMQHDSFKIAFLGSKRAGKTTYVSRFFDLSGAETAQMDMKMIENGLHQLGISVKAAQIMQVDREDNLKYKLNGAAWTNNEPYYRERMINLDPPMYPQPTTTDVGSYGRYPFIAEINKDVYVSFYDVAGEDAQTKQMVSTLAGGENEYLGVFCVVSGTKDARGNSAVFNQLKEARIHKDSPIAIIVTKFDTLKEYFDPSCHCTRTDYFDGSKIYQDSYLQHEIDYSSEEIRSYLMNEGLFQDISNEFKNVKFFGISSFNFKDSIHVRDEVLEDPGKLRFQCSSSRLELPFIWMLNQFGVIK